MKNLIYKYRHAVILLYLPFYMLWFTHLEKTVTSGYYVIETGLDNLIPFCEYFIIPYLLWFVYILAVGIYFFLTNRCDFLRFCIFLFAGMSISLLVCTIWPNGLQLRPELGNVSNANIFLRTVARIYAIDTPTNVCPSIHVLNSVGAVVAIWHSQSLKDKKFIKYSSLVLTVLIVLSTMFLKQHSVVDVSAGLLLSYGMYLLAYKPRLARVESKALVLSN